MRQLSIIIVNYNVGEFLKNCIQSCLDASQNIDLEIIVADNHSTDGSKDLIIRNFPQVIWIQNNENLGFSKANNQAVKQASGKYLLFMNPDTLVPHDIFEKLIPFAEQIQNFGALGVRMVDENNIYRPESKRNIPDPENSFYKLFPFLTFLRFQKDNKGYYDEKTGEEETGEVEILSGAFFFTTQKVFNQAGGFDESYFMYGEDIDLSFTILQLGYKNYYFGKSTILHYKGKSTQKDKVYYQSFFNAMEIFVKKYHGKPFLKRFILLSGLKLRYYAALFIVKLSKEV